MTLQKNRLAAVVHDYAEPWADAEPEIDGDDLALVLAEHEYAVPAGDALLCGSADDMADLGLALLTEFGDPRTAAVAELVNAIDGPDAHVTLGAMGCAEMDALAAVFALFGFAEQAARFLVTHAHALPDEFDDDSDSDDIDGDRHNSINRHGRIHRLWEADCTFGVSGDDGKALPAARQYVAALIA